MISLDQKKKDSFELEWRKREKDSKYEFQDSLEFYSNRQVPIWAVVKFKIDKTWDNIIAKVIKKPYYMDSYWKARYRGFLVCEKEDWERFVSHVWKIVSILNK